MANVVKRENMVISIREYTDGQGNQKKVWKTIGELLTWDNGNQSFEQWGSGGVVSGNIFEQQNNAQQASQQQGGFQQQPQQQGGFQQQPQQQGYQQQAPQQQGGFQQPPGKPQNQQ